MGGKNVCILIMVACLAGCQEKKKIGRKRRGGNRIAGTGE